jgi:hypothetical protein
LFRERNSLSFVTVLAQVLIKITKSGFNHFFLFAIGFDLGIEVSLKPIYVQLFKKGKLNYLIYSFDTALKQDASK